MDPIKVVAYALSALCGYFITIRFIEYSLKQNSDKNREGGVCEVVYINQLKALELRVAFLELKECDIKDFIEVEYDFYTVLKSEHDYGERIRIDRTIFYKMPITQTNQKYYEYVNQGWL